MVGFVHLMKWLLVLLSLLFLLSCAEKQDEKVTETDEGQSIIRFGITSAPVTLDPVYATDATSGRINRLIYQQLIQFGDDNLPLPGITKWQQINTQHYRFTLIKESYFHHGKLLNSSDIKATYDAVLNKDLGSPHRNSLKHIQRIEIIDNKTLDFYLSRPDPLFPAFLVIGILPADLLNNEHPFNHQPVGSGDFEFSHWPFDGQLFLKRRNDQQLFEFLKVKDPTVRVLKLLRGELDIVQNNLPPEHINYLKLQTEIKFLTRKGANYSYLGFNLQDKDTGQLKLRQAIVHALDRDKIIQYALGNAAVKASSFFPAYHWAGLKLENYQFNIEKSRHLMRELGYAKNKRLQLSYKTSSDPFRIRIATIIQSQLKKIFIDVNIKSFDWGTFYADIKKGKFQLYSLTWVGIKTPDIFRYVFHSHSLPPSGANRGRLMNTQVDQLIEAAEKEQDINRQAGLYRQLQEKLQLLLPYVSLWYEDNIAFFSQNLISLGEGYQLSPDGNYDALRYISKQN